jgi:hypothetical protein
VHLKRGCAASHARTSLPWGTLRLSQMAWISVISTGVVRSITSSNSMNSTCRLRRRSRPVLCPSGCRTRRTASARPYARTRALPAPVRSAVVRVGWRSSAFAAEAKSSHRHRARVRARRAGVCTDSDVPNGVTERLLARHVRAEPMVHAPRLELLGRQDSLYRRGRHRVDNLVVPLVEEASAVVGAHEGVW